MLNLVVSNHVAYRIAPLQELFGWIVPSRWAGGSLRTVGQLSIASHADNGIHTYSARVDGEFAEYIKYKRDLQKELKKCCEDVAKIVPGWTIRREDAHAIHAVIKAARIYNKQIQSIEDLRRNGNEAAAARAEVVASFLEVRLARIVALTAAAIFQHTGKERSLYPLPDTIVFEALRSDYRESERPRLVEILSRCLFRGEVGPFEIPKELTHAQQNYGTCLLLTRRLLPIFIANEARFKIWITTFVHEQDRHRVKDPKQGMRIGAGPDQVFIKAANDAIVATVRSVHLPESGVRDADNIYRRARSVLNLVAPLGEATWDKIIRKIVDDEVLKLKAESEGNQKISQP